MRSFDHAMMSSIILRSLHHILSPIRTSSTPCLAQAHHRRELHKQPVAALNFQLPPLLLIKAVVLPRRRKAQLCRAIAATKLQRAIAAAINPSAQPCSLNPQAVAALLQTPHLQNQRSCRRRL
ncbi:hypothetical protein M0R45_024875 [Rubus argutus]|uniref:Uncharacterized protein n=1 Tax=Rubus argutus TaxID=59490 RepID=A0AAW1WVH4_RUBAR